MWEVMVMVLLVKGVSWGHSEHLAEQQSLSHLTQMSGENRSNDPPLALFIKKLIGGWSHARKQRGCMALVFRALHEWFSRGKSESLSPSLPTNNICPSSLVEMEEHDSPACSKGKLLHSITANVLEKRKRLVNNVVTPLKPCSYFFYSLRSARSPRFQMTI